MPFEFLEDDLVLLGVGPFADEFRAEVAELKPRPAIVEVQRHPFAGRETDPLIEKMGRFARGRVLLVGRLGNRQSAGFLPRVTIRAMMGERFPTGYSPSRLALLAKHAKQLGFRPTALRHVIRSGQERQGCLSGRSEEGADIAELLSFVRAKRFGAPNSNLDALILRSGTVHRVESTTLSRAPKVIAHFGGGEAATAMLICRRSTNMLESRYLSPAIVESCLAKAYERLTIIGGDAVFENWPRAQQACDHAGLRIYRFYD